MPSFPKYMWAVAFTAGTGGMLFGYEIGIINQILSIPNFLLYFGIEDLDETTGNPVDNKYTDELTGLVTSSFLFGCVVGAAIVSFLADLIGRKFSIVLGGIIYTAGGTLQAASTSIGVFLSARGLSGISVGIMSMCVPLYIAETAPTGIRGRLTTVYQLMITFGILIASCVNGIIISRVDRSSELPWRMAFALQVIPGITLLVLMLPMPRSPRWLAEKGLHAECQRVIARLRGVEDEDDDEIVVEFRSIVAGVEYEKRIGTAGWTQFLRPGVRRRLAIGIVNQFFQQWTGINVILYYGASLFAKLHFDNINSSVTFIIINAFVNFAFTLPGMWGVERFGRRPLFIGGGIAMCLAYVGIFLFAFFSDEEDKGNEFVFLPWLAVMCIYLFTISFACTWGPTVWTYQSEIFPLRIRAKGTGLSTMSNWIWNAVIAYIHPVFACTCFVMTLYAWRFIPETRGKTLEEMDEVFKDSDAVLPSEGAQFSATVAALFSLRGHRPPGPHGHGDRSNSRAMQPSSSLSALDPFSTRLSASGGSQLAPASPADASERTSVHSTVSTARRSASLRVAGGGEAPPSAGGGSAKTGGGGGAGDTKSASRTSSPSFSEPYGVAVTRLLGGAFPDEIFAGDAPAPATAPSAGGGGGGGPLPSPQYTSSATLPLAAPFSATKKPLASALKKQSSGGSGMVGSSSPVTAATPAEELALMDLAHVLHRVGSAATQQSGASAGSGRPPGRPRSETSTGGASRSGTATGDEGEAASGLGLADGALVAVAARAAQGFMQAELESPAPPQPQSQPRQQAPSAAPGRGSASAGGGGHAPVWPPSFVVRLGQARAAQQQRQHLTGSSGVGSGESPASGAARAPSEMVELRRRGSSRSGGGGGGGVPPGGSGDEAGGGRAAALSATGTMTAAVEDDGGRAAA
ncbi:hypothetical protein HK405_010351, partial [Cladochytrium tenue]